MFGSIKVRKTSGDLYVQVLDLQVWRSEKRSELEINI